MGSGQPMNAIVDPALDVSSFRPGPEPADWLAVRITGRFDHEAAATCRGVSTESAVPYSADQLILGCRRRL
jgi:hypothetical protein